MAQKSKKPTGDRALEEEFLRPPRDWLQYLRSKILIVAVVAVASAVLTSLLWPADHTKNFLPGADHVNRFGAGAIVSATVIVIALLVYFVAKRTLWDLLQLLIVPIMLAAASFWFSTQQDTRQQAVEEQRTQDDALQAYLDQMSHLIIGQNSLRGSEEGSEVRTLARARTITVLGRLDPSRKTAVMQFLAEADLVQRVEGRAPLIRLIGADLSGTDLSEANLSGADLSEANVKEANLSYANLSEANLSEANLSEANLSGADLSEANVSDADLSEVDLSYAVLSEADLSGASGLSEKRLEQEAHTITGASMPSEIFSDDFSDTSSGWAHGEFQKNTGTYYVTDYYYDHYRIYNPPPSSDVSVWSNEFGTQEDMIVEVDAQVSGDAPHGTDTWGVICRLQDSKNYYVLEIGPEGYSDIYERVNKKFHLLEFGRNSEYIRRGKEKNHLRADCLGNKLSLFVNGHKVIEHKDSTFDSGVAGLYMYDHGDHKFEVLFDNFLVSSP